MVNSDDSSSEDELLNAGILRGSNGYVFYSNAFQYIILVSTFIVVVLRPRITRCIEDVVDEYPEELFRENFRVYRRTFNAILDLIRDDISTSIIDRGRHTVSPKTQLLLDLWYLATPDSFR